MIALNLLVLRCHDLERSRSFYELLGLSFTSHRHGQGQLHYAHETAAFVFELYPAPPEYADRTAVGFAVQQLEQLHACVTSAGLIPGPIEKNPWGMTFVVRDPDGRRVELKAAPPCSP